MRKIDNLCSALNNGVAFLVSSEVSARYYTNFSSSNGYVFVTKDDAWYLTDFRYIEAAKSRITDMEVMELKKLSETIGGLIKKCGIRTLELEAERVTAAELKNFRKIFGEIEVTASGKLDELINSQRIIKSDDEIEYIKKAQKITEDAYYHILPFIKEGVSERELALELEFFMRRNGASAAAFDLIVVSGENSSKPHGVPGDRKIQSGDFITMDTGAVVNGWHSDMTRTVAFGDVSDEQKKIYNIVLQAQLAACSAVKAGISCAEVDAAARDVIRDAGYGECFGHSTGHGVGLEIHEMPSVSPSNVTVLREGMIITVEPGIYLPGKFGVRIEDMTKVCKNGCRNLTNVPKEFTIL